MWVTGFNENSQKTKLGHFLPIPECHYDYHVTTRVTFVGHCHGHCHCHWHSNTRVSHHLGHIVDHCHCQTFGSFQHSGCSTLGLFNPRVIFSLRKKQYSPDLNTGLLILFPIHLNCSNLTYPLNNSHLAVR